MNEFGEFSGLVAVVLSLLGAVGAIVASWTGRSKWEPWGEDVPNLSRKVAALVSAVSLGVLWAMPENEVRPLLNYWAPRLAMGAAACAILYSYLAFRQKYQKVVIVDQKKGTTATLNVVGGFRLTPSARSQIATRECTVQHYYSGVSYDADAVWTRDSLAMAKVLFVSGYLGVVSAGTVALFMTGLLILRKAT